MYTIETLFNKFVSLNNKQITVNNKLWTVCINGQNVLLKNAKNVVSIRKDNLYKRWTIKDNKLHYFVMEQVTNQVAHSVCAELQEVTK